MSLPPGNLYLTLDVDHQSSFAALKKAYYRRAKECHPDRFGGDRGKEDEFKRLVHAFDILSDPLRRREYDRSLECARELDDAGIGTDAEASAGEAFPTGGRPIMDTMADDILEEMIVGNNIPRDATLQTLMRDIENTTRFLRFREAKCAFYGGHFTVARKLLQRAVTDSPENILYHFYLAEAWKKQGRPGRARKQYRICLDIGARRLPPQRLVRVYERLDRLRQQSGLLGKITAWLSPSEQLPALPADEHLRRQLSRSMTRMLKTRHDKAKKSRKPRAPTPLLEAPHKRRR